MNNKKGFTLIELLVVIAILAIIGVIVVNTVSDTLEKSTIGAFKSNYDILYKEVETRIQQEKLGMPVTITCDDTDDDTSNDCSKLYDISEEDYKMLVEKAGDSYLVAVQGIGKFEDLDLKQNGENVIFSIVDDKKYEKIETYSSLKSLKLYAKNRTVIPEYQNMPDSKSIIPVFLEYGMKLSNELPKMVKDFFEKKDNLTNKEYLLSEYDDLKKKIEDFLKETERFTSVDFLNYISITKMEINANILTISINIPGNVSGDDFNDIELIDADKICYFIPITNGNFSGNPYIYIDIDLDEYNIITKNKTSILEGDYISNCVGRRK